MEIGTANLLHNTTSIMKGLVGVKLKNILLVLLLKSAGGTVPS